ncbi:hypothetical protein AAMO2058_001196400 [Amorphochlora amoebiformis]
MRTEWGLVALMGLAGALMDKAMEQSLQTDTSRTIKEPEIIRLITGKDLPKGITLLSLKDDYLPPAAYIAEVRNSSDPGMDHVFWRILNSGNEAMVEHMTVFPIGKHIASLSYDLAQNLPHPTILRAGKIEYHRELEQIDHKVSTTPWVWSRIDRCQLGNVAAGTDELDKSWGCYFNLFKTRDEPASSKLSNRIASHVVPFVLAGKHRFRIGHDETPTEAQVRQYFASQYIAAQSHRYVFSPNEETQKRIKAIEDLVKWPKPEENAVIASVHIRRGDTAGFNCSRHQKFRGCTYTHKQVDRVRRMQKLYGVTHAYVMTEEPREVELARSLAPDITWMSLVEVYQAPIKQELDEWESSPGSPPRMNVEVYLQLKSEDPNFDGSVIEKHVYGYLADMQLASRADVHVLEASCTSASMLAISHGSKGYMPPHIPSNNKGLMSKPYWCSMKDVQSEKPDPSLLRFRNLIMN